MRTYETRNDLTKLQLAKLERDDPAAYLEYAAKKRKAGEKKKDPKCNIGNYQCRGKKGVACIPNSKGCSTDLKNINPARRQYIEAVVAGLKAEGAKPKTARIGRKLGAPIVELTPEQYGQALALNISQLKLVRGDVTREQLKAIGVDVEAVISGQKKEKEVLINDTLRKEVGGENPDMNSKTQKQVEEFLKIPEKERELFLSKWRKMTYSDFENKFRDFYFDERARKSASGAYVMRDAEVKKGFAEEHDLSEEVVDSMYKQLVENGKISAVPSRTPNVQNIQWIE